MMDFNMQSFFLFFMPFKLNNYTKHRSINRIQSGRGADEIIEISKLNTKLSKKFIFSFVLVLQILLFLAYIFSYFLVLAIIFVFYFLHENSKIESLYLEEDVVIYELIKYGRINQVFQWQRDDVTFSTRDGKFITQLELINSNSTKGFVRSWDLVTKKASLVILSLKNYELAKASDLPNH